MMKSVINKIIVYKLLSLTTLFLSCKNEEKIYLDFEEVQFHSNLRMESLKSGSSFTLYNNKYTIYLNRLEQEISIKSISSWEEINFTPVDEALSELSKISIDNLHLEKTKGLPKLFIVKKDKRKNKIQVIEVGQSYLASNHQLSY